MEHTPRMKTQQGPQGVTTTHRCAFVENLRKEARREISRETFRSSKGKTGKIGTCNIKPKNHEKVGPGCHVNLGRAQTVGWKVRLRQGAEGGWKSRAKSRYLARGRTRTRAKPNAAMRGMSSHVVRTGQGKARRNDPCRRGSIKKLRLNLCPLKRYKVEKRWAYARANKITV